MLKEKDIAEITPEEFYNEFVKKNQPVLIKNSESYLDSTLSIKRITELFSNKMLYIQKSNFSKSPSIKMQNKLISFPEAITKINKNRSKTIKYYISGDSIKSNLRELLKYIQIPTFLSKVNIYDYGLWYGSTGNITPLHFDCYQGILYQVEGIKKVKIYPLDQNEYLYIPKASKVDFWPRISRIFQKISDKTFKTYPLLKLAKPYEITLYPGYMLYIPFGWWHYVETIEKSLSLNYLFKAEHSELNLKNLFKNSINYINQENYSEIYDYINFDKKYTYDQLKKLILT